MSTRCYSNNIETLGGINDYLKFFSHGFWGSFGFDGSFMTLKMCPCCKLKQTTKNSVKKGRDQFALYFNCKNCNSTFVIKAKNWEVILKTKEAA